MILYDRFRGYPPSGDWNLEICVICDGAAVRRSLSATIYWAALRRTPVQSSTFVWPRALDFWRELMWDNNNNNINNNKSPSCTTLYVVSIVGFGPNVKIRKVALLGAFHAHYLNASVNIGGIIIFLWPSPQPFVEYWHAQFWLNTFSTALPTWGQKTWS